LESDGYRVIFDPFTGAALSGTEDLRRLAKMVGGKAAELTPAHYQEAPDRDILLRLQNNIKRRHLEQGEDLLAAAALERMTLIAPDRTPLWHELALLDARIGRYSAALDAARHALDHAAGDDERHRLAALVQRLGTRVS
jgi:regulator of sirC expression with transglutaminase-like and TPR domain